MPVRPGVVRELRQWVAERRALVKRADRLDYVHPDLVYEDGEESEAARKKRKRNAFRDSFRGGVSRLGAALLGGAAGLPVKALGTYGLAHGLLPRDSGMPLQGPDGRRSTVGRERDRVVDTVRDLVGRDNLDVGVKGDFSPIGPYFMSRRPQYVSVGTPYGELAAHELGHVLNNKLVGDWHEPLRKLDNFGGLASGAAFMLGNRQIREYAPWISLAMSTPKLLDEAAASVRGMYNYGKDLGAGPGSYLRLARAFGTYALPALLWPATLYALNQLMPGERPEGDEDDKKLNAGDPGVDQADSEATPRAPEGKDRRTRPLPSAATR